MVKEVRSNGQDEVSRLGRGILVGENYIVIGREKKRGRTRKQTSVKEGESKAKNARGKGVRQV